MTYQVMLITRAFTPGEKDHITTKIARFETISQAEKAIDAFKGSVLKTGSEGYDFTARRLYGRNDD